MSCSTLGQLLLQQPPIIHGYTFIIKGESSKDFREPVVSILITENFFFQFPIQE